MYGHLSRILIAAFLLMTAVEGTWGIEMHRNPLMWAIAVLMMASLAYTIRESIIKKRSIAGILSHTGMFLVLLGSLAGAPFFVDAQVRVNPGSEVRQAFSRDGKTVPLPFGISLEEFRADFYEDGVSPKQYTSRLLIDGKEFKTSVNHPCRHGGYGIYQADFGSENEEYSILKLVHDPWFPIILIGMLLLAAGAIWGLKQYWDSWLALAATGITAVAFGAISLARINFGTLVPALRSLWFIPHIALYMLAYSSLALALVTAVLSGFSNQSQKMGTLSSRLFNTASSLLLLGMICGAVWAKECWGDWWTWDAKECWAAVTWLLTILGTHLPGRWRERRTMALVFIILAFAAMQLTWYGVDMLPAARSSLHTYR